MLLVEGRRRAWTIPEPESTRPAGSTKNESHTAAQRPIWAHPPACGAIPSRRQASPRPHGLYPGFPIDYRRESGLDHGSPQAFARSLADVWDQVRQHSDGAVRMFVRFGGIGSRPVEPDTILRNSLSLSKYGWRILGRRAAATAGAGKRQADQMRVSRPALREFDYLITAA